MQLVPGRQAVDAGRPAQSTSRPRLPPDDWPNRAASSLVQAGGRQWHCQQAGSGAGLLLLHGTGSSAHSWRDVMPRLARRFRVLAVDLPGHGFSQRHPGERLSLPAMAAGMGELLAALRFRPAACVGHSAGAAVALRMALDGRIRPQRLIGLNAALLPFGGAWQPVISPLTRLVAAAGVVPCLLASAARDRGAVRRLLASTGSELDERGVALYRQLMSDRGHLAATLSMMANWRLQDVLAELPRLGPELVLVTTRDDQAVRATQAEEVRQRLPRCRVVELPAGGHLVHEVNPGPVSELLLELAGEGGGRRAPPDG